MATFTYETKIVRNNADGREQEHYLLKVKNRGAENISVTLDKGEDMHLVTTTKEMWDLIVEAVSIGFDAVSSVGVSSKQPPTKEN